MANPTIYVISARLEPDGSRTYIRESVWSALGRSIGLFLFVYSDELDLAAAFAGVAATCA